MAAAKIQLPVRSQNKLHQEVKEDNSDTRGEQKNRIYIYYHLYYFNYLKTYETTGKKLQIIMKYNTLQQPD